MALGELSAGMNLTGVRAHNERLVMSLLQRGGAMPGAELAKRSGLSPQTVSNILRRLEAEGFLTRGAPQRGRVGKPSAPMALDPDGALAFGLKIGRRSSDLAAIDLHGRLLARRQLTYPYPMPDAIFGFLEEGVAGMSADLTPRQRERICGIGIGAPSEIWNWTEQLGAPPEFDVWRETRLAERVARFSDLPVFAENDATAACRAEHAFGRGREFNDYAYVFIGSFIGGGVVMNGAVVEGGRRNAGAFGSLRTGGAGPEAPLIDTASLHLLEAAVAAAGRDPGALWAQPQDWSDFTPLLAPWIDRTAEELARAARNMCAVIDFEAVLIDGAFPASVRAALVERTRARLDALDLRGLARPRIEEARIGHDARALGAASAPIFSQFFLR
ncbi:ROK family transcriptional regulator [Rhodovulum sp. DZ06]|uniref:ROK family transcriptional regulator n=1 Tax=Rhodovulum sp. DZ06 TaxID=3425126 RepID=UPI003D33FE54